MRISGTEILSGLVYKAPGSLNHENNTFISNGNRKWAKTYVPTWNCVSSIILSHEEITMTNIFN